MILIGVDFHPSVQQVAYVDNERVCPQLDDAAWVCGKPGVLAAALPPVPAACFDHGTVGDELCAAAVSRCDRDWAAS